MGVATESRQEGRPVGHSHRSRLAAAGRRLRRDLRRSARRVLVGLDVIQARLRLALAAASRAGFAARAKLALSFDSRSVPWAGLKKAGRSWADPMRRRMPLGRQVSARTLQELITAGLCEIRLLEATALRGILNLLHDVRHLVLKAQLARAPLASRMEAVTLEVVSGLHGGVLLMLEDGEYQIGSTAEADIVLRDSGVMPRHAVLAVRRSSISLKAGGGDVTVGHRTVSQGHGCRLTLPLDISLGQARLHLAFVEAPRGVSFGGRYRLAAAGIAACAMIAIGLLTLWPARQSADGAHTLAAQASVGLAAASSFASLDMPSSSEGDAGTNHSLRPDQHAPSAPSIEEAMRELARRIEAANIKTLRVSIVDGRLAIDGSLSRHDSAAWSAIQHWFDQTYQGRLLLAANFATSDGRATPLLQLQAVWFGEHPYLVTADGAHFYQGATLDNGWTIRKIDEEHVLISKDGETVALTYR